METHESGSNKRFHGFPLFVIIGDGPLRLGDSRFVRGDKELSPVSYLGGYLHKHTLKKLIRSNSSQVQAEGKRR